MHHHVPISCCYNPVSQPPSESIQCVQPISENCENRCKESELELEQGLLPLNLNTTTKRIITEYQRNQIQRHQRTKYKCTNRLVKKSVIVIIDSGTNC